MMTIRERSHTIKGKITVVNSTKNKGFKLLNTDFSIPLSYENMHWLATFTPTYSIPFNKIETIIKY